METPIFDPALIRNVAESAVVAVLVVDKKEDAVPLAGALLAGGIKSMELTLRTAAGIDAIREIKSALPEMTVGAGTVLTPDQVRAVQQAGADFAVSPGVNPRVLREALDAGLPFAPGIATPSDIEAALEFGCRLLKFFPAEPSGGLPFLKAIAAPYAHLGVSYIPLGGLSEKNMALYLQDPLIAALGGSWIAPRDLIQAGDWAGIRDRAAASIRIARETRTLK